MTSKHMRLVNLLVQKSIIKEEEPEEYDNKVIEGNLFKEETPQKLHL